MPTAAPRLQLPQRDQPRTGEPAPDPAPATIRALTGLRALAALWVVAFHYRFDVVTLVPGLGPLRGLMAAGYLGVDVFFALSGFVLAYNYADRLAQWNLGRARSFVQNRVARVWPVHAVTLHLDLVQAAVVGTLGVAADGHRRTLSAYLQNLTMTHGWWSDRPSFNAPAWSISAEWAAYLASPLLMLALARVRRPGSAALGVLALYVAMLVAFALWALPNGNVPHAGMLRVGVEFTAGVLLLRVYQRRPRWLAHLALPLVAVIVVAVMAVPVMRHGYWLAPALGLLVLLVALDEGPVGWALSTRAAVFWGEASYALYMSHLLLSRGLHALVDPRDVVSSPLPVRLLVLILYAGALAAAAVLLRRLVEVPARRRLRHGRALAQRREPERNLALG